MLLDYYGGLIVSPLKYFNVCDIYFLAVVFHQTIVGAVLLVSLLPIYLLTILTAVVHAQATLAQKTRL